MDNPVSLQFPVRLMAFATDENGDETFTGVLLAEVTEAGEGHAEIGFTHGEERLYVAFRISDLQRAIKEASP
ncbi:MAG TPA: hypothetical protein VGU03_11120 [Frateuria sp.]|uniref:hypothetical protein n=1 Tax=Frateuria sp. TaxID=2211372 RepID=UPI002DE62C2A|nr:hypothetical protein [Frateuria sp.]